MLAVTLDSFVGNGEMKGMMRDPPTTSTSLFSALSFDEIL